MRKHLIFVQTILATTALINAMNVYAQEKITIPAGTVISARLASQLDSGQVHPGDLVTMDVLEAVRIKGELVIPHGALVMGHVCNTGSLATGSCGDCHCGPTTKRAAAECDGLGSAGGVRG